LSASSLNSSLSNSLDGDYELYVVSQKINHFTGFSTLLNVGNGDPCSGEWSTLQWLSMAFIAAAGVLVVTAGVVYYITLKRRSLKLKKQLHSMVNRANHDSLER